MFNRRAFLGLLSALLGQSAIPRSLLAAASAQSDGWTAPAGSPASAFMDIRRKAAGPGALQPRSVLAPQLTDDYDAILPELVDLISGLSEQRQAGVPSGDLDAALRDATELLGALADAERSPFTDGDERALRTYEFEPLHDKYLALYDSCTLRPERATLTGWHIGVLTKPENRARYEEVGKRLSIPWYFIGITHSLESGFNFGGHLHNGDPLRARTWQVPAGRPLEWNPPTDWVSSASDAMTMKNYHNQPDWTLARMLYRFERYNGFGYRSHGIESPYLWSFSNQYSKGKYVRDGMWSSEAVSRQCGAALLVKELVARGLADVPGRA